MENTLKTEWDLSKFGYSGPRDPKIKVDYHLYESKIKNFCTKWKGKKDLVLENFGDFLNDLNLMNGQEKLWMYLGLDSSIKINDTELQIVCDELQMMCVPLAEELLFADEIFKEIGAEKIAELANKFPDYNNYLTKVSENIKHLLSEEQEKIIIRLSDAYSDSTYDQYQGALSFDYNDKKMTLQELWSLRVSPKRQARMDAFMIISKEFNEEKNAILFGNQYTTVCKLNVANMNMRGMSSVMEGRNLSEGMDENTVNAMLEKVKAKYPIYQTYLKKKAELLGLPKLEVYDVGAPIVKETSKDKEWKYEEGLQMYLDTVKGIDNDLYEHSKSLTENGNVDVYPRKGKSGGAFCYYVKGLGEYVLLNWANDPDSVTTLAHEFGHAFHGYLSNDQNNINYHSSLCLAETASIFNETALFNALLAVESVDKEELISGRLDDLFATIFRQVMYVAFEKRCHESWKKGIPLSWKDYNGMWLEEVKLLYGDAVNLDEDLLKFGWMTIPHIYHTPFYCYAYSFGNILSLNVYQGFLKAEDKKEYLTKYKDFLRLGGSKDPKEAVMDSFGLDIASDEFYDLAFSHIEELIKKL